VRELERRGYQIVERNFRGPRGELDIVARDRDTLVIVEVRARRSADFGEAVETIGSSKRASLIRTTRVYLSARALDHLPVRFDVITFSGEQLETVRLVQNAFEVSDPWS